MSGAGAIRRLAVAWSVASVFAARPPGTGLPATGIGVALGAPRVPAAAVPDATLDGQAVMERAVRALYYPGSDMRARITMEIGSTGGTKRYRVMTALRLNLGKGDQRYLLYFHQPGDVRRMTCMVHKRVGANDARWIYVPLAGQIRRITAPERSPFLGSDFVREEFSGRDPAADSHRVVRFERREGRICYVVESVPKETDNDFTRYTSWIDAANFLPLRQEFRDDRDAICRVFTAGQVEEIRGAGGTRHPTPLVRVMANGSGTRSTRLTYESVAYDIGLRESDFSEQHMRVPLSEWLPENRAADSDSGAHEAAAMRGAGRP